MNTLLNRARECGLLRAVDVGLALTLHDLDAGRNETVCLLAALVSRATGEGHVCIDIGTEGGRALIAEGSAEPLLVLPGADELLEALRDSSLVGQPGDEKPLILENTLLYLGRYWQYERRVADALRQRMNTAEGEVVTAGLPASLQRLFPSSSGETDWQGVAAAIALLKGVAVISGGPGTGKTRTVASILALLIGQASEAGDEMPVIRLAAPTGKAAARLTESIRIARSHLDCEEVVRERIPDAASTLHRLIGIRPGNLPRHHSGNPLPLDVLVVDEASMIDLPLMARMLDALPARARLILLGDKDQLASVEAGSVFADISQTPDDYSASLLDRLRQLTGQALPLPGNGGGFSDCVALLRRSYRFHASSGIGALARAINAGDAAATLSLLESGDTGISRHQVSAGEVPVRLMALVENCLVPVFGADSPAAALQALARFRILCAVRRGPFGVQQLNQTVEELLRFRGLITTRSEQYRGRPVIITRNDASLHLFNGDVGILWPDAADDNRLKAWFPLPDGSLKCLSPARLPEHETTWAMTVHKSQGSEFGQVLVVLPEVVSPVLTRELLYTGITRAKVSAEIWGSDAVITHCVATRVQRVSGLAAKMGSGAS